MFAFELCDPNEWYNETTYFDDDIVSANGCDRENHFNHMHSIAAVRCTHGARRNYSTYDTDSSTNSQICGTVKEEKNV